MEQQPVEWPGRLPGTPLGPGDVHLARLPWRREEVALPTLRRLLSDDEARRASSYIFEVDRARYVTVRGCLRILLAGYLDMFPSSVRLTEDADGKPALPGVPGEDTVHFNVSHSGSWAVFGFARGRRIGVDVEEIRDSLPYHDIADRHFSKIERQALIMSADGSAAGFFDIWTRKEAYVKGRGGGLGIPFDRFSVTGQGAEANRVEDRGCAEHPGRWTTHTLHVAEGYAAAAAVEGQGWTASYHEVVGLASISAPLDSRR